MQYSPTITTNYVHPIYLLLTHSYFSLLNQNMLQHHQLDWIACRYTLQPKVEVKISNYRKLNIS